MRELLVALAAVALVLAVAVYRIRRSFTPPAARAVLDPAVRRLVADAARGGLVRIVVREPGCDTTIDGLFLTVSPVNTDEPRVYEEDGALRVYGPPTPATLAAVLLTIRDETGVVPHAHFAWTEEGLTHRLLRHLFTGTGETAPVTREVLRRAEPDQRHRPVVHLG
ncbi:hypothetical protein Lfu02_61440 [Longispora fulva]|uniref:Uncharacterized protein n=1 Tax=Longispora fulva TaxID=619741 RepID=A0A8J7KDY1_9ACTN|nr:hypothetical protein [Longispora fulva]MBG6134565.1 hypothetical protein [Longispora fulva]GIG61772.1 hypothetical protein Lfu02_61440 [Longispora fulva]